MNPLVSTDWLAAHSGAVKPIDASWYMPEDRRNPAAEFEASHIPGAVFFDIDAICDRATDLPHMLPPADLFARAMGALGIGDSSTVVVYDGAGLFSAPRLWWMLRAMGHGAVSVLDGGLPKWRREGRELESGPAAPTPAVLNATLDKALVRDFAQVKQALESGGAQVGDARSAARFTGSEAEPRPGLRAGHMPGARNVHYRALLNPDGTMKSEAELRAIFAAAGIDPARPVVTTCGSGISAAILMLGLARIGAWDVALYDGSWAEWGGRPQAPVATGP
jgi:thiosulfate/3-mercaptopyruvate sulfurtransferase